MDELVNLVGLLRSRIAAHGTALQGNEALTRYALIDPLLRVLGWNIEEPAQVVPEYGIPSNRARAADYALFTEESRAQGVPEIVIEAKKLGSPLTDAAQQAVNYCTVDGFEHFVVTDGDDWQLFGTRRKGNLDAKRIVRFKVRSDTTADVCRKALALWRQGFEDGSVNAASAHIDAETPPSAGTGMAHTEQGTWRSLASFVPEVGTRPLELQLPDGAVVGISTWKGLMIEVTKSLVATGELSGASPPLRTRRRYILAAQPKHPDGKDFTAPHFASGLHIETHYSARDAVKHARRIVAHAGADATGFRIRMAK